MIASLPMYDPPPLHAANDRLWGLIRSALADRGIAAPPRLTRGGDLWDHWLDPGLVLSQTCGLPFRSRLHDRVVLIGTPDYGLPGCPPGYYRSVLVARADDPRSDWAAFSGARFAFNDALSESGWAGPQRAAAAAGVDLVPVGPTGAHRASALAVAEGRADHAGIDAQTWRILTRTDDWTGRLRVVAETPAAPGLPLIGAAGTDPAPLRAAVAEAIAALHAADRAATGLRGIVAIPAAAYLALPLPSAPAPAGRSG
ncbi:MAG: phosphate/phosphite/phosphonate ABC transporter substrate-binding protein [Gemmobacter sp.]